LLTTAATWAAPGSGKVRPLTRAPTEAALLYVASVVNVR